METRTPSAEILIDVSLCGFCFGVGADWATPSADLLRRRKRYLQRQADKDRDGATAAAGGGGGEAAEASRQAMLEEQKRLSFVLEMDWRRLLELQIDAGLLERDGEAARPAGSGSASRSSGPPRAATRAPAPSSTPWTAS